jgi:hypothetical protein
VLSDGSVRRGAGRCIVKAGTCRSCPAAVAWIETVNGKAMLVDAGAEAFGDGLTVPDEIRGLLYPTPKGYAVASKKTQPSEIAGRPLYRSHFATCPAASNHRRG